MLKLMPPELPSQEADDPCRVSTAENRHIVHCNNIGDISIEVSKGHMFAEVAAMVQLYYNAAE